jgi:hypothetical protein
VRFKVITNGFYELPQVLNPSSSIAIFSHKSIQWPLENGQYPGCAKAVALDLISIENHQLSICGGALR